MNATIKIINDLPIVYIDGFYDDNELKLIMQDCLCLASTGSLYGVESGRVGVARSNGVPLKKGRSVFLDSVYADRNFSNILNVNRKLFRPDFIDIMVKENNLFRYLHTCNRDSTLFSYFEDSDYYEPHHDTDALTAISWFYQEPKKFEGGNLIVEGEYEIECVHGRIVLMLGITKHQVTEIKMKPWNMNKNLGRFCFSQFLSFQ